MNTIIRKAYWNYEKEEKWLNEMSAKGLALTDYSWWKYAFTDCQPGEYIYRLELLRHRPEHPASQEYVQFMEDNCAEHIASYMRWVYFRKKASDGTFDIYSDADNRIKHYMRVLQLFAVFSIINIVCCLLNIRAGLLLPSQGGYMNFIAAGMNGFIGIALFVSLCRPLVKKIRELKKGRVIRE